MPENVLFSPKELLASDNPAAHLMPEQTAFLLRVAPRYVWWKTPEKALWSVQHLLARIMDYGTLADLIELRRLFGEEILCEVLACAVLGQFRPRSWSFWHYQLGIAVYPEKPVPSLPTRRNTSC